MSKAIHSLRRYNALVLPPFITLAVALALWQTIVRLAHISPIWVPAPSDVARAAIAHREELALALWTTAKASIIGFALSAAAGIAAGVLLGSTRLAERAFYPFTVFLQTVPLVAIAPLLVKWFGIGLPSVVVSALIVSLFPVIANTLSGMRSVDPALRDLFRLYQASWIATLCKLRIPSSLPQIITGLRIASGLAVIGAIVGEFAGGTFDQQGLGILVLSAKRNLLTELVFAAVAVSSLLGLVLFVLVNTASYFLLRHWHESARDR
jgi:NitT/TauT family transport system permease protein